MVLFDLFKRSKTAEERALGEMKQLLNSRLLPGGDQELVFRAKKTVELSNGKLDLPSAGRVYVSAKTRIWLASTMFDGERELGIKGEELIERTKSDAQNKLSTFEAASIIFYALYDKIDPTLDAHVAIKQWSQGCFGCDDWGVDSDQIAEGIGEFGFEPTNPIPVRGVFSNSIYLERLRTSSGQQVKHKRLGSLSVPNIQGKVDEYEISREGEFLCKLYLSPYNRKISGCPPSGFLLVKKD